MFMNDGAGGLLPSINYPTGGNQPRGLGLLDANGDGNLDALVANRSSGILSLLLGNGNGTFQAASTFQGNVSNETALAVGDANGDGIADFFVGGYSSSDVALFLGDGVGGFYQSATRSLGGQPWMIVAGDVDGDGNLDVAAATANGGDAVVVRGDGAGGLLPAATYPAGSFSIAIDLGDVDGDGDLDMIASNYGSADFTVYRNLGNGTFASPITLSAPQAGSCMLVVDLNGDEKLELVGVDEQADVLLFFDVGEPLVQLGFPSAALDVNGVGGAPGFLGQPNVPVTVGSVATLGIGGHPGGQYAVALGVAQPLGLPTSGGTFNLALAPTPIPVLDGFNGLCPCTIPPTGQAMIPLQVPAFLPVGFTATLQGAVANPANLVTGWSVTNPVRVVFN
ncbi:MAG: hypothetical protein CMJ83_16340 [Planctomycetes bacterium]|nr:hypothetical protein [Planctomycetota bacterium]